MNEVTRTTDASRDLTVLKPIGLLTVNLAIEAIDGWYADSPTANLIWDLTDADLTAIDADKIKRILRHAKTLAHHREGGRSAFVIAGDLGFGLSRMYGTLAEAVDHPIPHRVFRTMDEALQWIES